MDKLTIEMFSAMKYAQYAYNADMDRDFCKPIDAGYRSVSFYFDEAEILSEETLKELVKEGIFETAANPFENDRIEYRITDKGQEILWDNPEVI